jgi:hypothetical protein
MTLSLDDAWALRLAATLWHNPSLDPHHPCKGYADANPNEAATLDAFVHSLAAGGTPSDPAVATPTGRWLVATIRAALAGVSAHPPPPPPSGKLWGISPGTPFVPDLATQAKLYVDLGATCPRIATSDSAALAMTGVGIKHWYAWMDKSGTVAQAVAYLRKYPQCLGLELGNELNLDGAWTSQMVADQQKAFYAAAKAVGVESRVMLSSVGNDISHAEHLSMLDWCKSLAAKGCVPGKGFTIANYHNYGVDPHKEDLWQELWTVGRHGTCAQDVFGKPPFVVTEFGAKIGWSGVDATTQAQAASAWPAELARIPECLGGHWFLSHDGTAWAGFGLIDQSGNHRPSYDAFKAAIS